MNTKKIYLIRHGETEYNKMGIVQGSGVDSDLNEVGIQQSNNFFNKYKHITFDKVYTSKLKRSIQSVMQFIKLGIPSEALEELNEICWGDREGQKITPKEDKYYHFILDKWKKGNIELAIKGGESPLDVQKRQKKALQIIMKNTTENTILVCMHGRAIRILLTSLMNKPLKNMNKYKHQNLCLYLLEYNGNTFKIVKENDITHLK